MNLTIWIMLALAVFLTVMALIKDQHLPLEGLMAGGKLLWQILPGLMLAFVAAGMISVLLPREESGLRGLVVATVAGSLTPGGPFVQFPIIAALLRAGAGVAPIMTYISSWSLLGMNRFLVYEVPLMGWRLAISRLIASFLFPIIIGLLTRFIWARLQ